MPSKGLSFKPHRQKTAKPRFGKAHSPYGTTKALAGRATKPVAQNYGKGPYATPTGSQGVTASGPSAQGLPVDPLFELQRGQAFSNYGNTTAGINYERGRTQQEFGFDDPSDPFNRSAMLKRAYDQSQRATTGSMAARGQLYSGATSRNLDEGTFGYQRGVHDLRKQYEDLLHGYSEREAAAAAGLTGNLTTAYGESIGRATQERPEDPGVPYVAGAAPAGKTVKGLSRPIKQVKRAKAKRPPNLKKARRV